MGSTSIKMMGNQSSLALMQLVLPPFYAGNNYNGGAVGLKVILIGNKTYKLMMGR